MSILDTLAKIDNSVLNRPQSRQEGQKEVLRPQRDRGRIAQEGQFDMPGGRACKGLLAQISISG